MSDLISRQESAKDTNVLTKDLIRRQDAIDSVGWGDSVTKVIDRIKSLPSAEQKTGKWTDNHNGTFTCDQCGCKHSKSNYCPNCGAKMGGDSDG